MALKDTIVTMRQTLADLARDLEKASLGNKSAAQRVRTGTIQLAKTAKLYRKESVHAEGKKNPSLELPKKKR